MSTQGAMGNTHGAEESVVYFLIFSTPIRLNTFDLSIKEALYMSLKLYEDTMSISTGMH
jgi:hypothetical protein